MKLPKVSVIMGIYNCASTLEEAMDSLLNQTYQSFEIILCDDGSEDRTFKVAKKYKDLHPKKVFLLKNDVNMGLNYTLNKCLKEAKGDYIARMDGDDVSLPTRFEEQVKFLNENLDFDLVSTAMITFDESGDFGILERKVVPVANDIIKATPFNHASSMIRREAFLEVGGYSVNKKLLRVEDWHLWIKMYAKGFRGYNLKEPLYKMRDDRNATLRRNWQNRRNEVYVRVFAFKTLKPSIIYLPFVFRPILVGLLPLKLYTYLHKKKLVNVK